MRLFTKQVALSAAICAAASVAPSAVEAAPVLLQNATATFDQGYITGLDGTVNGVANENGGWAIYDGDASPTDAQTAVFEAVSDTPANSYTFTLSHLDSNVQHTIGKLRLSVTTDDRSFFADGANSNGDVTANWIELTPTSATATNGTILTANAVDNTILASQTNPDKSVYTITAASALLNVTGFRLEVLTDPSLPDSGPGRAFNGNIVLTEFAVDAVPEPASLSLLAGGAVLALRRRR